MKEDVIEGLPQKNYLIHREDMPPEQVLAYDEIRSKLNDAARGTAIKLLHHIRSVSLHPDRVDAGVNDHLVFVEKSGRLKAAMNVLRRFLPKLEISDDEEVPQEVLEKLIISDVDLNIIFANDALDGASETIIKNKNIYFFAVNYNVLRIMNGMAGLEFS